MGAPRRPQIGLRMRLAGRSATSDLRCSQRPRDETADGKDEEASRRRVEDSTAMAPAPPHPPRPHHCALHNSRTRAPWPRHVPMLSSGETAASLLISSGLWRIDQTRSRPFHPRRLVSAAANPTATQSPLRDPPSSTAARRASGPEVPRLVRLDTVTVTVTGCNPNRRETRGGSGIVLHRQRAPFH